MKNLLYFILIVGVIAGITTSCEEKQKQQNIDWAAHDDKVISEHLAENNIDAIKHSSGVYYRITKEGNGKHPNGTSVVKVNYKGYLLDGKVFDEGQGVEFPLGGVIQGWTIGIPFIDKGGSGQLFIPSFLGYGYQSPPGIPPNSVLIFDVDLLDF